MTDKILIDRSVVEQALEMLNRINAADEDRDFLTEDDAVCTIMAIDELDAAIRAALEQPNHIAQHLNMVPEGWKPVPVEPTDSQIRAAQDAWWHACNSEMYWDQIYAAMLAAAPQPPVVEQPQVEQATDGGPNLLNPAVRDELAISWGYVKPQPPRQPLTDAQIDDHMLALLYDGEDLPDPWGFKQGVRAAERAHGIGGEA